MRGSAGSSRAFGLRTAPTSGCARCRSGITCRRPGSGGSRPRASMCRPKTCSPSAGTRGSIPPCRPGAPSAPPATSGTSSGVSTRARIPATERSPSASRPRSSDSSLFGGRKMMNKRNRKRLLYGVAGVMVAAGITYACKDFLNTPPQGIVNETTLLTHAGVEGSLIAAYRSLDCSSSSVGSWGCAASNWMWGNIPYYRETDTDFRKTNVGVNATAEILADLTAAIALLPAKPRNGQVGRATSWTAKAYKGRVQVYAGDYAGAVTTLEEVQTK